MLLNFHSCHLSFNLAVIHHGGAPIKYNAAGVAIEVSKPRECRNFNGVDYLMEEAITGDFALIRVSVTFQNENASMIFYL